MNCIYPSYGLIKYVALFLHTALPCLKRRQSGEVVSLERCKMENLFINIPFRRLRVPLSGLWEDPAFLTGHVSLGGPTPPHRVCPWTASLKTSRYTPLHILKSKHILQRCFVFGHKA